MEVQKTIFGESKDKNVGKSITKTKSNSRFDKYYNTIIGHLGGRSGRQVFPIGENVKEFNAESSEICKCLTARYYKGGNGTHIKQLNNPTHSNDRVYSDEGISPTLNTAQGGNRQPFIQSHSPRNGNPLKGGTGSLKSDKHCFTIDRSPHYVIGASRGRNPANPSDRTTGSPTEQRLEINETGTSNSLTTIQKDNLVVSERIRRLTPTECERLQGFPDNWTIGSDSQRYKQCGNAVTTNVIEAIITELM